MIDVHQPVITHATAASDRSIAGGRRWLSRCRSLLSGQKKTSCHIRGKKQLPPGVCSTIVCMFRQGRPKATEEKYVRICHCFLLMVNHLSRARLATERTSMQTTKTEHGVGRCVWPRSDQANRACDAHTKIQQTELCPSFIWLLLFVVEFGVPLHLRSFMFRTFVVFM